MANLRCLAAAAALFRVLHSLIFCHVCVPNEARGDGDIRLRVRCYRWKQFYSNVRSAAVLDPPDCADILPFILTHTYNGHYS